MVILMYNMGNGLISMKLTDWVSQAVRENGESVMKKHYQKFTENIKRFKDEDMEEDYQREAKKY